MSASERRQNLLAKLLSSRHNTCENLARELNVTTRTIYSDVETLMCAYPIEVIRGRYGGVKVSDWFYPSSTSLAPQQFALLVKLRDQLNGDDLIILNINAYHLLGGTSFSRMLSLLARTWHGVPSSMKACIISGMLRSANIR